MKTDSLKSLRQSVGRWLEQNLTRVFRARVRRVSGLDLPAGSLEKTINLCLAALRPRDRWPENTRVYAAIRARLAENPVAVLAAFGAATAAVVYLGFGPAAIAWLRSLLSGPV